MKFAVVIPLTLVLAAGPWLCCCTAGHIARSQPVPASVPHKASCCAPGSEPTESPDVPPRSCSCQAEIQPATVTASSSPVLDIHFSAVLPIQCGGVFVKLANSVNQAKECPLSSFLDSHDLLRVFHILRC